MKEFVVEKKWIIPLYFITTLGMLLFVAGALQYDTVAAKLILVITGILVNSFLYYLAKKRIFESKVIFDNRTIQHISGKRLSTNVAIESIRSFRTRPDGTIELSLSNGRLAYLPCKGYKDSQSIWTVNGYLREILRQANRTVPGSNEDES